MLFIIPQCNQIGYNFSELFLPVSRSWLELRLVFWSFAALTLAKRIQMFRLPSSRPNRRYPVPFCTCTYPSYSLQDPANILRHMSTVICHVASVCVTLSGLLFLGRQLWGGGGVGCWSWRIEILFWECPWIIQVAPAAAATVDRATCRNASYHVALHLT